MISVALPLIALFILLRFVVRRIRQAKRLISDHNGMKKISANPLIFGGNAGKTWFYDDQFLYEVKNNATRKIALATIIKIGPGNIEINSRRFGLLFTVTVLMKSRCSFITISPSGIITSRLFWPR